VPRDDEAERRHLREACLEAMPLPGQLTPRVSLFQWAREASPSRVLRLLQTIDGLHVRLAEMEALNRERVRLEGEVDDDATLRADLEAEWDECMSLARAFYRAVRDLPGTWSPALREVMQRAETSGLHRFD
jgi:hypothetical protein